MESPKRPVIEPREAAAWVALRLREHGHVAYFAGGCVRDRLLGIEPSDFDVVTDAHPDRVRELFRSAVGVGESFGVMLVRRQGQTIEVATFRSDGPYHDGRHPESVSFADERSDAARRDFTINAIFEDPTTNELVDYFDGAADLEARVLRAVGDPEARMSEDHLRALRAVRFAARFDLEIEDETRKAITDSSDDLAGVSRERIGGELRRMLAHPSRVRAVELLESSGLDAPVLLETMQKSSSNGALVNLGSSEREPMDALAAWILDRGGAADRARADHLRDALLLSNQEHHRLRGIFEVLGELRSSWSSLMVAGRKRLAAGGCFPTALELFASQESELAEQISLDLEELAASGLAPEPLVDGNDLIDAGLHPGPCFKRILDALYDAQLEGRVADRASALALAQRLASDEERGSAG